VDYFPTLVRFTDEAGNRVPMAELISHDGRPFRDTSGPTGPAIPVWNTPFRLFTSVFASGAAEKYDFLLHPPAPGRYQMQVEFLTWRPGGVRATRTVTVIAE
jgi:hypothetical protein